MELSYDVANAAGIGPTIRARLLERLDGAAGRRRAHHRRQRAPHPARQPPAARERLVEVLREAAAPPPRKRRPTKPTRGSKERRLAEKKRRGQTKQGRRGPLGLKSSTNSRPSCRIGAGPFVERMRGSHRGCPANRGARVGDVPDHVQRRVDARPQRWTTLRERGRPVGRSSTR